MRAIHAHGITASQIGTQTYELTSGNSFEGYARKADGKWHQYADLDALERDRSICSNFGQLEWLMEGVARKNAVDRERIAALTPSKEPTMPMTDEVEELLEGYQNGEYDDPDTTVAVLQDIADKALEALSAANLAIATVTVTADQKKAA